MVLKISVLNCVEDFKVIAGNGLLIMPPFLLD